MEQSRMEALVRKLKARGCHITPQRMAVLEILLSGEDHPTTEQIYGQVQERFPMTSRATIYKTLALLKEMGEVRELEVGDGRSHYEGDVSTPHAHAVCLQCGQILDLEVASLSRWSRRAARETGYRVLSQRLDFFGLCPTCQQQTA